MSKSKQIAKLLKADISMTSDLAQIAKMLEKKGRGGDTILAHITRREAEMLKDMGGAGTVNPETGLLEFFDGDNIDVGGGYNPATGAGTSYDIQGGQDFQPAGMSPQEVAAANPDLYYGGQITPQGQADVIGFKEGGKSGIGQVPSTYTPEQIQTAYPQLIGATTPFQQAYFKGQDIQDQLAGASGTDLSKPVSVPTPPAPEKSWYDKLTTQDMIRLGLAGGLAAYGGTQAQKGAKQAEEYAAQQRALAAPYQTQGKELVRAAQAGELTPTGQQSLQALQARLAQGVEQRGGVGAAQATAQAEAYRQQLLQQQYDYGLKVSNIGDNIALGAIKTGMQADQALQQASMNFYTQLAAIAGGVPIAATARG